MGRRPWHQVPKLDQWALMMVQEWSEHPQDPTYVPGGGHTYRADFRPWGIASGRLHPSAEWRVGRDIALNLGLSPLDPPVQPAGRGRMEWSSGST